MTPAELEPLERRRRKALGRTAVALAVGLLGFPVGLAIGEGFGTDAAILAGEGLWLAALFGLIGGPMMVADWQRSVTGALLDAAVAGRPGMRRADGKALAAGHGLPPTEFLDLAAVQESGLAEPFATARVENVLYGGGGGGSPAGLPPFALAELRLLNAKGYRVFAGVLGSFRLARPRPGLTIVARDRGLVGNLAAWAGSPVERITLEDPRFEGVFEAYGTDQVDARVILTATMLERLQALDEHAHARGFTCSFGGGRLMLALPGVRWRPAAWRLLQPSAAWVPAYRSWIEGLVELPARVAATLDLVEPVAVPRPAPAVAVAPAGTVRLASDHGEVFSRPLWRFVGEVGIAAVYLASGLLFGGLAAFFGRWGLEHGFPEQLAWQLWALVTAGLAYGAFAVFVGLRAVLSLLWTWNAPLRGLRRPRGTAADR